MKRILLLLLIIMSIPLAAPPSVAQTQPLYAVEFYPLGYADETIVFEVIYVRKHYGFALPGCPPGSSGTPPAILWVGSETVRLNAVNKTYILQDGVLADSNGNIVAQGLPAGHVKVRGQGGWGYICARFPDGPATVGEVRVEFRRININITVEPLFGDVIYAEPRDAIELKFRVTNGGTVPGWVVVAGDVHPPGAGVQVEGGRAYLAPGSSVIVSAMVTVAPRPSHDRYNVSIIVYFNPEPADFLAAPIPVAVVNAGLEYDDGSSLYLALGIGFAAALAGVLLWGGRRG